MWSTTFGKSSVKILLVIIVLVEASMGIEPCSPWVVNFETLKCYRVFCERRSQYEAEKVCQENNGHLATICSKKMNDFAALMAYFYEKTGRSNPRVWVGIHWKGREKWDWTWESGSNCEYRAWWTSQLTPDNWRGTGHDEECAHFVTYETSAWNQWNDLDCRTEESFICETEDCTQL
ncbi:hypothetical protein V3C99_007424 [Haemonchus contortus]|nr:unnamed protein product [Haemonchus contortus]